jgi:hypothetical protein
MLLSAALHLSLNPDPGSTVLATNDNSMFKAFVFNFAVICRHTQNCVNSKLGGRLFAITPRVQSQALPLVALRGVDPLLYWRNHQKTSDFKDVTFCLF